MGDRPTEARPIGPNGLFLWPILEPHDYTLAAAAHVLARLLVIQRPIGPPTVKRILTNHAETDHPDEPPPVPEHPDMAILDAWERDDPRASDVDPDDGDQVGTDDAEPPDPDDAEPADAEPAGTPGRQQPEPPADVVAYYRAALEADGLFAKLAMRRRDLDHDEPTIRIMVERYWTHEQAAAALADYYPQLPHKTGRRTPHKRMTALAKRHMQPDWFDVTSRARAYDRWFALLSSVTIFPGPVPDPSPRESHATETHLAAADQPAPDARGG